MRRSLDALVQLAAPSLLVVAVGLYATRVSASNEVYFLNALVSVSIVVAIYVFVGNSGVVSFGQISFVAIGAFAAGVMTVPLESKKGVLTTLFPLLRDHTIGDVPSLLLAAALGGLFAFAVGLPLMRLNGLAAGIATFAVLEITHNVLQQWTKIGPGATTLSLVPESTGPLQGTLGALVVIAVAFAYQRSRLGRQLRASREDPAAAAGVDRVDMLLSEVVGPHLDVVEPREVRREQRPDGPAADYAELHARLRTRGSRNSRPPVRPDGRRMSTSAIIAARTTRREPEGRSSLCPSTWTPCSAWLRNESSPLTASAPTTAPQRLVSPPITSMAKVRKVSSR